MTESHRRISGGMLAASFGIFLSRISGLLRDIVFAAFWGTGDALAAFLVAFTIPNLFRRLFGEGALSEGFVPQFTHTLTRNGRDDAFTLLSNVLTVVTFVLALLAVIGSAGCLIATAFMDAGRARLTIVLTAFLLPYTVFVCLVGFLTGVMTVFGKFSLPNLSPVVLNGLLIVATLIFCPLFGVKPEEHVYGLVAAVLASGLVQVAGMVWLLRRQGYRFRFIPAFRSPAIRELTSLVLPAFAGAAVYQVNVLCDRILASWLGGYAVTSLYYSERLVYLPIGVFAVALSAACLPVMSQAAARDDAPGILGALFYSLRHILFLTMPCVLVFMLLADDLVALLFQRGSFDRASVSATAAALLFYAPGIPAFAAGKIVRSAFYARKDTRTPVKVATACVLLNLVLNLILMWPLQQRGLALATVISTWANVAILSLLMWRTVRVARAELAELARSLLRLAIGLTACGMVLWWSRQWPQIHLAWPLAERVLAVAVSIGAGAVAYLAAHLAFRSAELREMAAVFARRLPALRKRFTV